ncbi:MAG: ubiquinol-cytochrome C chaperone [Pseudorhodoplanes sp.]|nr:ubiquinol-cytochrome C chaperone [Pseudorhodoplanes sp.]
MKLNFFARPTPASTLRALYGAIVAQARNPVFYRSYRVPDTVDGRFDMIVLHLSLFLHRTESGDDRLRRLGQGVFDLFCAEMDGHMRETGVGDLAVPKRMQAVVEGFYGRHRAYGAGLAANEGTGLAAAIARNVYGRPEGGPDLPAGRLATYMREAARRLAAQQDFAQGIVWPDAQAMAGRASSHATETMP